MKVNWRTNLKWLLTIPIALLSTFVAFVGLEFSTLLYRPYLQLVSALHFDRPLHLFITPLDRFIFLVAILLWLLPPAFLVGYALRAKRTSTLRWGTAISLALLALFIWSFDDSPATRWTVGVALLLLAFEIVANLRKILTPRTHFALQFAALCVLFAPCLTALVSAPKLPSQPQKLWSVILQPGTWQAMNTGSEYGASRQLIFAGDRVVVVFDVGLPEYQGKQPMSKYRVLSLDRSTGAIKNQKEFIGRWGNMPYIYATDNDQITMQNDPVEHLTPDLVEIAKPVIPANQSNKSINLNEECGRRYELGDDHLMAAGCGTIRIMDPTGKIIATRKDIEGGYTYAGSDRQGTRFALQAYDERGDPSFLLFEQFFIYNTNTITPIATVPVRELPERQSWTAFSPDGIYFAVGNPNNLSLYRLPDK